MEKFWGQTPKGVEAFEWCASALGPDAVQAAEAHPLSGLFPEGSFNA